MLKRTELFSAADLAALRDTMLRNTLLHAAKNVPFYQKLFVDRSLSDFSEIQKALLTFPLIDKGTIRLSCQDFLAGPSFRRLKATSGGSTGNPFVFYMDRFVTRQIEKAFIFDQWKRVGYHFGDAIFNLRGRTPSNGRFLHHDRLLNIYFASSFNLSAATVGEYVSAINRVRPRFLHGYPSTMYQLAVLVENSGKKLEFQPAAVFCGSEKLFMYQREKIESVFGCRAYHWYGHSECLALGGACEYSDSLHFYPQYGVTELLPSGVLDERGRELHEIVATGFNNPVMPLIRYRTGDYAVLSESQVCRCGRNYLLVDEVVGRQQEFIVASDGSLVSATSLIFGQHYAAFEGLESIKLHQQRPGEIEVVCVKGLEFREDHFLSMQDRMLELIGNRFTIKFVFSSTTEKSPLGKAKLVEQELNMTEYLPL